MYPKEGGINALLFPENETHGNVSNFLMFMESIAKGRH
jgi:hypothetical protein